MPFHFLYMGEAYFRNIDDSVSDINLIEAKYAIGKSIYFEVQLTLSEFSATNVTGASGNTGSPLLTSSVGLESPQNQIQTAGGGGYVGANPGYNPAGCPEVNEYVWINNHKRIKAKSLIKRQNCFLYNPLTRRFNRLLKAEIIKNVPLFEITTKKGVRSLVSQSDKIITSVYDKTGKVIKDYQSGSCLSLDGTTKHYNLFTDSFSVENAGFGDIVVISLESEFIYASGSNKNFATLRHNRKQEPDEDRFDKSFL